MADKVWPGVCRAMNNQRIDAETVMEAHPACVCPTAMAAAVCQYGHMLECHFPLTCQQAGCTHQQTQALLESEV